MEQPTGQMKGLPLRRTLQQIRPPRGGAALLVAGALGLGAVVLLSDRLLERLYEGWRPRLEQQVGRIMGHPLQLGPFQGVGPDGLRVGTSRFLAGPHDGSTASVRSLRVLLDPLASWRQRQLVLDISLSGATAELRPNRHGQVWVLGSLPPGGEPPPLELHFRMLRQGDLAIHGLGSRPEPLRLQLAGQVGVYPRQRRLDGRARIWLRGSQGVAQLEGGGNWKQRLWQGDLVAQHLPLTPLLRYLPRGIRLDGHADGRLRLGLDQARFRCGGRLQLRAVRWHQSGLEGPIASDLLPVACADDRLTLRDGAVTYGRWAGRVSALVRGDRSLTVRLSARPPADLVLPSGALQARLRGRWRDGALRSTQLDLTSGSSSLQAQGTVGRSFDLAGWWRLNPADLPRSDRLPVWLRSQPIGGRFGLTGPLGSPALAVQTRLAASHPVFGAWQASLLWSGGLLNLKRFEADHLSASATLPLRLRRGHGFELGALQASLQLRDFPLAGFGPLVGTRLQGRLDGSGTVRGPLSALVPSLALAVRDPAAGPLLLREAWSGRLDGASGGGGMLRLQSREPAVAGRITARLDARWRPLDLLLERGGGSLSLRGDPRLYRWQARALPLQGLELLPAGGHPPQPLQGLLAGSGQLGLQPLAFSGQVALHEPGLFGLAGRELTANLHYAGREYALRGTVRPLSGGTIDADLSGQWRGPFHARFQARQLSSLLFREIARAWDGWRGLAVPPRGKASDLGRPAIETLGLAVQEQLVVLNTVRDRLEAWDQEQRSATRADRLSRLQMRMDADLTLQGPDLRRARARLNGRGHLWLTQSDRDLSLARDPFEVRLEGPLFQGGGTFALSGLTLSLLSLLTPVPESLRGYLSVAGSYRLGGKRPELEMTLSLDQAELAATGLRLERGRLDLAEKGLEMDLALQAEGASSTVDLSGLLPLEASSKALELRLASRGDGLRFLTALAGRAVQWRKGSVDLRLLVRGSVVDPIANGFLRFREGEYGFIGQTLQGVEATVLFDFQQMLLQDLSARVGPRGRVSGEGRLGLVRPLSADPTLAVRLQGVPFAVDRIKAVADGRLELGGSLASPALGGNVAISHGVINARPGQLARLEEAASEAASAQPAPTAGKPATTAGKPSPTAVKPGTSTTASDASSAVPNGGSTGSAAGGTSAASTVRAPSAAGVVVRPTSMNELLQRRWDFREPLVLLGPDVESSTNLSLQEAIPNVPWLRFQDLQLAFGPDLRMVIPTIANFTTGGSLRISGRLDPSLRASGVVRLLSGRLNLFTTTFGLDPDAPNVAVFTPTLGLVPYLDIALRTRIADNLNAFSPSGLGDGSLQSLNSTVQRESQTATAVSPLNQIKLIRVTVSVSGPADRIAENLRLRSNPPLPQERLVALIGGNSLAGLQGGQAGTALATALGQSLLSPLLGSLSDALGQRVSFALYPTYVNQEVASGQERFSGRVPPRLVLAGEVGLDITDRINASVLAAPNRSDVPAQLNLNYKASNAWNLGASIDTQGAWQTVLQFFFRF